LNGDGTVKIELITLRDRWNVGVVERILCSLGKSVVDEKGDVTGRG
jgi:hypothetical protein